MMQDPLITIRAKLKADWSLEDALAEANIKFSTGWYESEIVTPQVSVTLLMDADEPFELGYGTIRVNATYEVNVWVTILKDTDKERGLAKKYIWDMQEEVKRILKANHTSLTDIAEIVLNQTGRRLDDLTLNPPVLRWSKEVLVLYDI